MFNHFFLCVVEIQILLGLSELGPTWIRFYSKGLYTQSYKLKCRTLNIKFKLETTYTTANMVLNIMVSSGDICKLIS